MVTAEQICGAGSVTLSAKGTGNGTIKWYADAEGTNEIGEGDTFSTDIELTSNFYVKEVSNTVTCLLYTSDAADE